MTKEFRLVMMLVETKELRLVVTKGFRLVEMKEFRLVVMKEFGLAACKQHSRLKRPKHEQMRPQCEQKLCRKELKSWRYNSPRCTCRSPLICLLLTLMFESLSVLAITYTRTPHTTLPEINFIVT